jgi:hypothetical protein
MSTILHALSILPSLIQSLQEFKVKPSSSDSQKKEQKNVPFNKVCHETGLRVLQYKLPRVLSHADETIGGSKIRSKDLQA